MFDVRAAHVCSFVLYSGVSANPAFEDTTTPIRARIIPDWGALTRENILLADDADSRVRVDANETLPGAIRKVGLADVDNELEYHSIYDEQGGLYGGMEARENWLVTLYDSKFDSLGARTISQFLYPDGGAELKEIERDETQQK